MADKQIPAIKWVSYKSDLDKVEKILTIYSIVKEMLNDNGINTCPAYGDFQNGKIRLNIFNAFKELMPDNDYLLTVDGDEFQQYRTFDIHGMIAENPVDFYTGYLVDCYNDVLTECTNEDLNIQYPKRIKDLELIATKDLDIPKTWYSSKIVIARAWVPVCFIGSHDVNLHLMPEHKKGRFVCKGEVEVLHFRWRKTLEARLRSKTYNENGRAEAILNFFNEGAKNGTV
jgi:hypothetical protein